MPKTPLTCIHLEFCCSLIYAATSDGTVLYYRFQVPCLVKPVTKSYAIDITASVILATAKSIKCFHSELFKLFFKFVCKIKKVMFYNIIYDIYTPNTLICKTNSIKRWGILL